MIGDTSSTDIRGANNVGKESALVETGGGLVDVGRLTVVYVPDFRLRGLEI